MSLKRTSTEAEISQGPAATKYRRISGIVQNLRVKKLSENAVIPKKGSELAAGFDLVAAYETVIEARGKALVKTDIAMAIPEGCYGRIAPRSGLAWKHMIDIGAGVIDADYRGNVGVVMFNLADKEFKVDKGMRVAQLILERYEWRADIEEVQDLDDTQRGDAGYGSTGLQAKVAEKNGDCATNNGSKTTVDEAKEQEVTAVSA